MHTRKLFMAHNNREEQNLGTLLNIMESSLVHQVVIDKEDWRHRPSLHQVSQLSFRVPDTCEVPTTHFFLVLDT